MKDNKAIEKLNEGTVNQIYEEVTTSNGNVLVKVAVVAVVAAAGVGLVVWNKKRKNREMKNTEEVNAIEETE